MHQMIEYLKQQLFTERKPDAESLLEVLYDNYINYPTENQDKLRERFRELRDSLPELDFTEQDKICCIASALCAEQDRVAFREGVCMGARLIVELLQT